MIVLELGCFLVELSECVVCTNLSIVFFLLSYCRFSTEDVSAQNQVKASVQRRIRQSIAEEVSTGLTVRISESYSLDKN